MSTRGICLSDSTIAAFLERRMSDGQRAEVEDHIDGCASCRRLVIESVSAWPPPSSAGDAHTTHPARPRGTSALAKGSVVGRFVVLDLLGTGGMGVVYTAYDPELDRKVALKLLHPRRDGEGDQPALLAEAQVMARINHASVIAVYEVGTYRNQVFAAMELIEGTTLRRWMTEHKRSWRQIVDVFVLAGDGLAAAHAAGVIHRDFKPENVLIGDDGRVKVSDFGLATASPAARGAHVAGTPGYVSVEQLQGLGADERSDQFSFCIALHEALHGGRPFSARGLDELVAEVRRGPQLHEMRRGVPAWLNRVVRRGLALAPEERHPSMRALTADIRRAIAVRRARPRMVAAVVMLALLTGAFAVAMDDRGGAGQPCGDAADRLAGVWDSSRRDAVRSAFLGTATPSAAAEYERAAAAIDRYAASWIALRTEVCEAGERRHESPRVLDPGGRAVGPEHEPPLHDLRMACLDRARIQLRALSDALGAADANTVREAAAAAAALPPLDACSD
ncbi:MAG TPA: protein kinase, partial [Kofleriaceae bacterium]